MCPKIKPKVKKMCPERPTQQLTPITEMAVAPKREELQSHVAQIVAITMGYNLRWDMTL